ncbi:MAG: LPXTG cell wall anchor domain-containing protein [Oscillospiraceae bacterium]|jgi:LPXTG-motif cell wall-anchored protein|nr:LPXTG cell wall anchor domain-containing protein [Oscillospiraceae bacterium]
MSKLCESAVEEMAIEELQSIGYTYTAGIDLASDAPNAERASYGDVLLTGRVESAFRRLNPDVPADAIKEAVRKLARIATGKPWIVFLVLGIGLLGFLSVFLLRKKRLAPASRK